MPDFIATSSKLVKEKKTTGTKKRKSIAEVTEEEAEEEVAEELVEVKVPAVAKPRAKKVTKSAPVIDSSASSPSNEEVEASYQPSPVRAKSRSRSVSAQPAALEAAAKKVKKEKVSKPVLGEKSTNGKSRKPSVEPVGEKKQGKKRELISVVEENIPGGEQNDEPKKKKKKSLFPGVKKFVWSNATEVSLTNFSVVQPLLRLTCEDSQ